MLTIHVGQWWRGVGVAGLAAMVMAGGLSGCASWREPGIAEEPWPEPVAGLEVIASDQVMVGVLPQVGGRIVLCRRRGGKNVLLADPAQWTEPESATPVPAADLTDDKQYHGHIVWLGPQSQWWTQQDVAPDRKARAATWPGDPWLRLGRYEVIEKSATRMVLRGPDSPVSGICLTKTVAILPDGRIEVAVNAVNTRQTPVAWGLWSNTRLPGDSQCYATYCERAPDALRLEFQGQPETTRMMPYYAANDVFAFAVDTILRDRQFAYVAKAFLQPERDLLVLAAFTPDTLFIKEAPTAREPVALGHAPIEIYQQMPKDKASGVGFLGLKFHGPYRTLQPGESMDFTETWMLLPWLDGTDPERQVKTLRELRPADFDPM